ncbi:MAG: glyoxalase [Chloroflexi bacterium]|nr:MAG: glyoxalase [Chloroflexota bacterium]
MTEHKAAQGPKLIVYPVSDIESAKKLFASLLGVEPYADAAFYVGYKTDELEIGLDPHGKSSGPIVYWDTDDVTAKLGELTAAGWKTKAEPKDVGGGMLVASVTDANGNVIGLRAAGQGKQR